jgi:hypothetical protein
VTTASDDADLAMHELESGRAAGISAVLEERLAVEDEQIGSVRAGCTIYAEYLL